MGVRTLAPIRLPEPRGPVTEALVTLLGAGPEADVKLPPATGDWLDEDLQLALYICYELHYRGFTDVPAAWRWEWDPGLLAARAHLEKVFLDGIEEELPNVPSADEQIEGMLIEPLHGTGVSHYLLRQGERWQAREYLVHRSLYHLKEADPQAWVIPRLHGAAQAALVAVEYDEYGAGRPEAVHSRLFGEMMADFGLDPDYGAYVDAATGHSLAVVNLMSLFGLHSVHRGALVGQFARVEITSSPGSRRLAEAFAALGAGADGTRFYREHIEADAVHEQLIRHGVIDTLIRDEPELEADIAFGLAASALVDDRLGTHLLGCWERSQSSLRKPLSDAPARRI
ncbi:hypothetical protein ABH926_004372 [Catenulispora sp. GP43]|uniref:iron-containing redox enzyme family protein n=1 Tax=Catenulispora sp. GP43 TaxID=3156263 RepID=UPI003519068C